MARTTANNQLAKAIETALAEYGDDVTKGVQESVKKITKAGVTALKKESAAKFGSGPYSKSWTSKYESDRLGASGVIYSKKPGLPHLLENGHTLRNGAFWPGKPHISTVDNQIAEDFEKEVAKRI